MYVLLFQMVFAGMMCSSSIWGSISDKYGRKAVSYVCFTFFPILFEPRHEKTCL